MAMPPQIRLLIVDDHAVYRLGLRTLFEQHEDFLVVAEADTGDEAVRQALETQPHVAVVDASLPDASGIEITRQLVQRSCTICVTVLNMDDEHWVRRAFEAGATACVLKADATETVVNAVRCAADRKLYLSPSLTKRLLDHISSTLKTERTPQPGAQKELTEHQLRILRLVAEGKRNRQIAQCLGISQRTVGNHIATIYGKVRVRGRAQAIVYAVQQGLVRV